MSREYPYEVTLEGDWHRKETLRREVQLVQSQLALYPNGFRHVSLGLEMTRAGALDAGWDLGDGGTFRLTMDVDAPNASAAIESAKRMVRREIRGMYLCTPPSLTFL